jgi:hypothetical protein
MTVEDSSSKSYCLESNGIAFWSLQSYGECPHPFNIDLCLVITTHGEFPWQAETGDEGPACPP